LINQKLMLFIDWQNFYNGARRSFFSNSDNYVYGQIKPFELGNLICSRAPQGCTYKLEQVRVYTGRPDSTKEPKAYAANSKQSNAWEKSGAVIVARQLRYPQDWPHSHAEEKGVDVALAIDFISFAIDHMYDVGVIASTDTDLKPALEFVNHRCYPEIHSEVAAWYSSRSRSRLSIANHNIWCYWLKKADYDAIADLTDYTM